MKKIMVMLLSFVIVVTLTGCIGNYREGYKEYSLPLKTYSLYYQDLADDEDCPTEDGHLYTLYVNDGNTFQYEGIRSGDGCHVELLVDTGSGFTTVTNLLNNERITVADLESVRWTFEFVIQQSPDFTIGSVNYVEYFEEIGEYEVYVVDYDDTICHDDNTVFLFEYRDKEYNVVGAPSGDGCRSEYFVYVIEETDDSDDADTEPDGELMTVNAALQQEHITVAEITSATFESKIIPMYIQGTILATEIRLYFYSVIHEYDESNPYVLTDIERTTVTGILATNRYRYALDVDDEDTTPYMILNDKDGLEHRFQLFELPQTLIDNNEFPTEQVIAILTVTDISGDEWTYELYPSGIRLIDEELNVFTEYNNQTYLLDLLEELDE